jgi:hypothetical protein
MLTALRIEGRRLERLAGSPPFDTPAAPATQDQVVEWFAFVVAGG